MKKVFSDVNVMDNEVGKKIQNWINENSPEYGYVDIIVEMIKKETIIED